MSLSLDKNDVVLCYCCLYAMQARKKLVDEPEANKEILVLVSF